MFIYYNSLFLAFDQKIGNGVSPPKDVQEQEKFQKIQYWIQGLLQASQKTLQVWCCTGLI